MKFFLKVALISVYQTDQDKQCIKGVFVTCKVLLIGTNPKPVNIVELWVATYVLDCRKMNRNTTQNES